MNDFSNLPTSWQIKTLGEIFLIERGGSPRPIKNFLTNDENGINWIKIGDTKNVSKYIYSTAEKIKPEGKKHSRFVEIGDLILSNSMSFGRPYIMKTIGCIHDGWVVFRNTKKLIDEEYAYYALISNQIYAEFSKLATGSTVKNLSIDRIKQVAIPLPPLEIQKRIVARLESAFEKIEKGSAHLQDAKTKLAKYKQSLLKSAFDGTLTATASLQGVEKAEAIHKVDCHDLTSSNLAMTDKENPKLPQGWTIKTLGEIAQIKGGKRLPKDTKYAETATPYPYIRVTDFENMSVNMTNLKYLTKEVQQKIKNYTISKDDIYISIAGSIGKVGIIPDKLHNANLTENAAKIVHSMDKKYLAFYLNSSEVQSQIAFFTKATTQPKLALYRIENLKIKIPPLETQKQIVKLVERHFECADKTDKFIESALNKAKQLKQSLLKSAFLGELV